MEEEKKEIVDEDEQIEVDEENSEAVVNTVTTEKLGFLISSKDRAGLAEIFETVPDIDIAEAADELDIKLLISLFRDNKASMVAAIFDELSQDTKEALVAAMTDKDLIRLVAEQEPDDLTDTVGDMPANLANKVLAAADKDTRADINKLLKFKDDTAGAIMTTEFIEVRDNLSVKETIDLIRKRGKDAETVYTIFVKDSKRKFVGTVALEDLIWAKDDEILDDVMDKSAPYCYVDADKEEVANTIRRYDLNAIAIVNDEDCLVGIVTVDDAVDVVVDEANEDIEKMNAVSALEDTYLETSPFKMMRKCVPWIMILLVLGTFSSMVLSSFQDRLSTLPVLAAFVPVLMDTGGNAGGQTIALMIRGLALKEFGPKDFWKIIWKEFRSAVLIALCIAAFAFLWFTMEQYTGIVVNSAAVDAVSKDPGAIVDIWRGNCWSWGFAKEVLKVSALTSGTLAITMVVSKMVAVVLPLGAAAIKKDPALVSQPILTTIIDVTSLLIYFLVAELLILQFLH